MSTNTRQHGTIEYLRHAHGQALADLFAGDDLYGVDMSLPKHERVKKAKKQVAKDRANANLAAVARGVSAGRRKKSGGRGRGGSKAEDRFIFRISIIPDCLAKHNRLYRLFGQA